MTENVNGKLCLSKKQHLADDGMFWVIHFFAVANLLKPEANPRNSGDRLLRLLRTDWSVSPVAARKILILFYNFTLRKRHMGG